MMNTQFQFEEVELPFKPVPPPNAEEGWTPRKRVQSIPHGFRFDYRFEEVGAELVRNMEVRSDDIWVVTPPKCGTTWMQELSWCMGNNMDLEKAKQFPQFYRFPFLDFDFGAPDKDGNKVDLASLEQNKENIRTFMDNSFEFTTEVMKGPRFIKTHMPFCFLPEKLLETCKVIYVARNMKDVCVSSYYMNKKPVEFSEYAAAFKNGEVMIGNWFEHMRQAWDLRENKNLEFVWYEDMKDDLRSVVKRISKHLDKDMSEEDVEILVKHLDIDNLKKNDSVNKITEIPGKKGEKFSFIRKGVVGDWRNHLTDEESDDWDRWIEDQLASTGLEGMRGWKA